MNLARVSTIGKVVLAACTLFLILTLFTWQEVCADIDGPICSGRSAWQSPPSALAAALVLGLWFEVALTEGSHVRLPEVLTSRPARVGVALLAAVLAGISQYTFHFTDPAIGGGLSQATGYAQAAFLLTLVAAVAEYRRTTTTLVTA